MAYTVDISKHLMDEPKFLKIGPGDENVLRINDKKNTVLMIQQAMSEENLDKALKLGLGEEGFKKIEAMDLTMAAYENLVIGMLAAIQQEKFEVMMKRFREASGK